jgi:hypothetical protein
MKRQISLHDLTGFEPYIKRVNNKGIIPLTIIGDNTIKQELHDKEIIKTKTKKKKKSTDDDKSSVKTINQVLLPYNEKILYNHPWLDIETWGPSNHKGNYTRLLGENKFTLFKRSNQWKYHYNDYYSDDYRSLPEILKATFEKYGRTIRIYIPLTEKGQL